MPYASDYNDINVIMIHLPLMAWAGVAKDDKTKAKMAQNEKTILQIKGERDLT
jgi:hypothetical protein